MIAWPDPHWTLPPLNVDLTPFSLGWTQCRLRVKRRLDPIFIDLTPFLFHTDEAREQLNKIKIDRGLSKRYKAVKKAIEFLSLNPRHPGLQTHEFTTLKGQRRKGFWGVCWTIYTGSIQNFLVLRSQRKSDHHYRNHSSSIDRINPTKKPFAPFASCMFNSFYPYFWELVELASRKQWRRGMQLKKRGLLDE